VVGGSAVIEEARIFDDGGDAAVGHRCQGYRMLIIAAAGATAGRRP
jgi:hypothetical protein